MKIAVIGGGTAGFIAAAHMTKYFPAFELYHIFDPNIPTIGVGEGSTPSLTDWLEEITSLSELEFASKCSSTRKYGISFENWGTQYQKFFHHFYPIREAYAYHVAADKLVELLKNYVSATTIHKRVVALDSDGVVANIQFADDTNLEVDFAIDARGLPKSLGPEHIEISLIPTNAAIIRQAPTIAEGKINVEISGQKFQYQSATRAIARPHGWIFMIPLTNRTSYGYIYNHRISDINEVKEDFDGFLERDGVSCYPQEKQLKFPNFACRTFFDGAVYRMGNAGSFLEPLEALAIISALMFIETLSNWPLRKFLVPYLLKKKWEKKSKLNQKNLEQFNNFIMKDILRTAIFISWHYGMGSRFDSEFWRFAKSNFYTEIKKIENTALVDEFEHYCQQAKAYPHAFKQHQEFIWSWEEAARKKIEEKDFAGFYTFSFAEMGYGLGYF